MDLGVVLSYRVPIDWKWAHVPYQHNTIMRGADDSSVLNTVEPDLIATEMIAFPSKSSKKKNYNDIMTAIP